MADFLVVPEKAKPRELIDKLTPELDALKATVDDRSKVLDEIVALLTGTSEAETKLTSFRKMLFSLFHEKLRCSEAEAADEYSLYVSTTLEAMGKDKWKATDGTTAEPEAEGAPLAYVFREDTVSEAPKALLESLGVQCEVFSDPRVFLTNLRKKNPNICILDFQSQTIKVVTAVLRTIRNVLGDSMPIVALVPAEGKQLIEKAAPGVTATCIEEPISENKVAQALSAYFSTEKMAQTLATNPSTEGRPIENVPVPPIIDQIFAKVTTPLIELTQNLELFEDAEQQFKYYAEKLAPVEQQVIALLKKARHSEEKLDLVQSLRAFGLGNSRNLVATITLVNAVAPGSFTFDRKTGLPSHEPKNTVSNAIRIADHFGEDSYHYNLAFSAGLPFDVLAHLASRELTAVRKNQVLRMIDECHRAGLRRVDAGLELGKKSSDLAMAKHIISTILLCEAGKIAMALFLDDYRLKMQGNKTFQLICEEQTHGIAHNLVGAIICQSTPNVSEAALPVLFAEIPVHLRMRSEHDASELAALCRSLA